MKKVCMVVQDPMVKGGIAAVVNGYRGSQLEKDYQIVYVESYKDGGKYSKLLKAIRGYFHFLKVLVVDRPDLVHIHSSFGPSFYRKLPFIYMASWAGVPIVNHIHGADFESFFRNAVNRKKEYIRKVYDKCSVLIALSAEWKECLSRVVDSGKIRIIENYSILNEKAYEERNMRACNNRVLFLGELGQRKGCFDIPAVVEMVVATVPEVRFVLCGAGSRTDESAIKKLIEEKKVTANVEFPGWVRETEKDRVLREADVFFLPSYNEGMPMSVLDAMGYGLPVVSTKVGGIPKIVHSGENGICCDPGDVDSMAGAITELLTNDQTRKSASAFSMKIVKEGYSLEAHLKMLEKVYEEIT
ncbi:MAG: glycosyltransferase family 4 protein [Lachnospiraceae bacterium]|nr:glycosyltransferase family 4 protein [Lachnospiraceae bacterium]